MNPTPVSAHKGNSSRSGEDPFESRQAAHVTDPQPTREPPRFDVAGSDVEHLAHANQVVERGERLFERRVGIGLMNEVQIEPIGPQPRQAFVDLLEDVPS